MVSVEKCGENSRQKNLLVMGGEEERENEPQILDLDRWGYCAVLGAKEPQIRKGGGQF